MARVAKISRTELRKYIRKNAGIKTPDEMCEECDVSRSHIVNMAAGMKVSLELKTKLEKRHLVKQAILQYYTTLNYMELSRKLKVSPSGVLYQANKMGIQMMHPVKRIAVKQESIFFKPEQRSNWLI